MTEKDTTRTLSARYHKDGSEILIAQPGKNPRRLTPRECARLMGYPDTFKIVVSDTQAYRQFGNSVVMPVVERIAKEVSNTLSRPVGHMPDFVLSAAETPRSVAVDHNRSPVTYARQTKARKPRK